MESAAALLWRVDSLRDFGSLNVWVVGFVRERCENGTLVPLINPIILPFSLIRTDN